jgi:spore germination cell wall hydrolase CwlJ-like protein
MKAAILALLFPIMAAAATEREIVAATLILEAGGEYHIGSMEAVHEVIQNRAKSRRQTLSEVCLSRWQFSCWNGVSVDSGIAKAKRHPRWDRAMAIVGTVTNYTHGADHYHADYVTPWWAKHMTRTAVIGRHIFYRS